MVHESIWARFHKFAFEHGLWFSYEISDGKTYWLTFSDHDHGIEHEYVLTRTMLDNTATDAIYDEITNYVMRDFGFDYAKTPVAQVDEVKYDTVQANICGLNKNEYIALELTKAWASTPRLNYVSGKEEIYHRADIINTYRQFVHDLDMAKEEK